MARFCVTGGAGFIGSNLVRALLARGEPVRVVDDFSTGRRENLSDVLGDIELIEGSICDSATVRAAMDGVEYCLHQAAVPSVPRSVADPWRSNRANVEGTVRVFLAARDAAVKRVVYASSSSVYGNVVTVPTSEDQPLAPLSPYAVTKAAVEMYARVFTELYGTDLVGLRYFNVYGPFQDPESQYAAVVPIFIRTMLAGRRPPVDGDGSQSRDLSYIDNVVSANLLACQKEGSIAGVYNIACGTSTSVLDLVDMLNEILGTRLEPDFRAARPGDIRTSCADVSKARAALGYEPTVTVEEGLRRTVAWYRNPQCRQPAGW